MTTYIDKDTSRKVPTEWNDAMIRELFDHARDLAQNGNPAGFFLISAWEPWVAYHYRKEVRIKNRIAWDYTMIRLWIAEHPESVENVWQFVVRSFY